MRSSILSGAAVLASIVSAVPVFDKRDSPAFPLSDGFPSPSTDQVSQIEDRAHGALANGPPPSTVSANGITTLQLIAFNELHEVAFFTELIQNITSNTTGYDLGDARAYVLDTLQAILAQEELHALTANGALAALNQTVIQPCKYTYAVTDFQSAIALAATFTDLVLGTLQEAGVTFAKGSDFGLVGSVGAVIGNEAEQEGFFRLVQKKRPSSKPFLTSSTGVFAFTALQGFVVPGSCPNLDAIKIPILKPLSVDTMNIEPKTQNINLSFAQADIGTTATSSLSVVFINGVVSPIVKPLEQVSSANGKVTFSAQFPFDEFVMDGFTTVSVTNSAGPFADAASVAAASLLGPGLIEVESESDNSSS